MSGGGNVISVGPLSAEQMPGGTQYCVIVIVPERRRRPSSRALSNSIPRIDERQW
jgi:hypothetical protein